MGAELAIDIDVRISDELRLLMRARNTGQQAQEPPPPAAVDPVACDLPEWQTIVLRQDGARPLLFRGAPVFERCHRVEDLPGTAEIRIALYLGEGDRLYAGLSAEPPANLAGRAHYRAAPLQDGADFARLLESFAPEACLETLFATDATARDLLAQGQAALRSAFTSMAADCLSKGMMPA